MGTLLASNSAVFWARTLLIDIVSLLAIYFGLIKGVTIMEDYLYVGISGYASWNLVVYWYLKRSKTSAKELGLNLESAPKGFVLYYLTILTIATIALLLTGSYLLTAMLLLGKGASLSIRHLP